MGCRESPGPRLRIRTRLPDAGLATRTACLPTFKGSRRAGKVSPTQRLRPASTEAAESETRIARGWNPAWGG